MKNFRRKKLIIMISVLALFALVLVGCAGGEVEEEPVEEPMQEEPVEEPAPSTSEEPASDDMNNTQY